MLTIDGFIAYGNQGPSLKLLPRDDLISRLSRAYACLRFLMYIFGCTSNDVHQKMYNSTQLTRSGIARRLSVFASTKNASTKNALSCALLHSTLLVSSSLDQRVIWTRRADSEDRGKQIQRNNHRCLRQASLGSASLHLILEVRWDRIPAVREMLMLVDREEISRGLAEGLQYKQIACRVRRDPSVISREVARHGGRSDYRAAAADEAAGVAQQRPKRLVVERSLRLRALVCRQLRGGWSPASIAGRLPTDYPDDQACRVSHETIVRHEAPSNRVEVETFAVGPSQRSDRSWGQPDPGNAGDGGKRS
jgi:hypothetical protein